MLLADVVREILELALLGFVPLLQFVDFTLLLGEKLLSEDISSDHGVGVDITDVSSSSGFAVGGSLLGGSGLCAGVVRARSGSCNESAGDESLYCE